MTRIRTGIVVLAVSTASVLGTTTQFQFYPTASTSATNHLGAQLPRTSTVLVFVDNSPGTWDPIWSDITDGGTYGGNGDTFWFATNTITTGAFRTPIFSDNSGPYYNSSVYAVVLEWNYTNQFYVSGVLHGVDDGTYYAVVPGTYVIGDAPTLPQQFAAGVTIRTSDQISVVPEPTTLALIATGMGVVLVRRRKKQATGGEESA
jgi:hypothetical protein